MKMEDILHDVQNHNVLIFMKGTKEQPACGFSAVVVQILKKLQVDFECRNVLGDEELRRNIKEFTNWPTLPQLYVKGQFVGGADIVRDLYSSGKLKDLFIDHGI